MKPNSLAALPSHHTEPLLATFHPKPHRQRTDIIHLPLAAPPDEITVQRLNTLAGQYPFCILYKARKHDTL